MWVKLAKNESLDNDPGCRFVYSLYCSSHSCFCFNHSRLQRSCRILSDKQSRKQFKTQFEDGLVEEYRTIARNLPIGALLGDELDDETIEDNLKWFYCYIDLSNEQVFLRREGRVSRETWKNWEDGIESQLSRPAFERAWKQIKEESGKNFQDIQKVNDKEFDTDPNNWR